MQSRREVVGELRRDVDGLARHRMGEGEPRCVKELALETQIARPAVGWVARDGEVDRREMDADLVRPPRLERHPQKRVARQQLDDLEVRDGLARRVCVERVPLRVVAVPADRRFDRPAMETRAARDEREILASRPLEPSPSPGVGGGPRASAPRRAGRTCRDRDDGRSPAARGPRHPRRRTRAGRARASRLRVPVRDARRGPPACRRRAGARPRRATTRSIACGSSVERGCLRRSELQLLPAFELVALRPRATVDENTAASEHPFGDGARADLGQRCEKPVEARAGGVVRDAQPRHERGGRAAAHVLRGAGSRSRRTHRRR